MLVVVPEPGQVHDRRPDVGLVGPGALRVLVRHGDLAAVRAGRARAVGRRRAVQAEMPDARPGERRVVGVDLGGIVAVIPGESGVLGNAGPPAAGCAAGGQEVVRPGEHGQRRRPRRVGVHHVQDGFLGGVREVVGDPLGGAGIGIARGEPGKGMLEAADRCPVRAGLAGEVELRRGVLLHAERRRVVRLGGQQAGYVGVQLAE